MLDESQRPTPKAATPTATSKCPKRIRLLFSKTRAAKNLTFKPASYPIFLKTLRKHKAPRFTFTTPTPPMSPQDTNQSGSLKSLDVAQSGIDDGSILDPAHLSPFWYPDNNTRPSIESPAFDESYEEEPQIRPAPLPPLSRSTITTEDWTDGVIHMGACLRNAENILTRTGNIKEFLLLRSTIQLMSLEDPDAICARIDSACRPYLQSREGLEIERRYARAERRKRFKDGVGIGGNVNILGVGSGKIRKRKRE